MSEPKILTERDGNVLIITVNRAADARNAFDRETADLMEAAIDQLDAEDSLFAGIITGAGNTFSAGADLKAVRRGERPRTERRGGFGLFKEPSRKPLVAAVEGYAVAGGFELALACDIIIAATNSKFGLPEVKHNLVAVGGGLFRLPKRMPYHIAMDLALTGDIREAAFFHQYGVVHNLVEPGETLAAAKAYIDRILQNGPTALAATKEIVANAVDWTEADAWQFQQKAAEKALQSEDRAEGLAAFAEKRKPVWKGR
ncbi:MAG: enoyl-CoA hydratase [Ponticaulis sp.]|nr:enoyl-CoA hydratase [Ponticaulis sp.]|tara:strand:+ start:17831 stop:18601 length:771 start_codon:yes stop_codon:yes gene_type:complete